MDKFKVLSGEELVVQGAKKLNSSLPELGLKDIIPNGSWLEQKQIQKSLEARRHIVEVERIEKCGTLSQADWNEELQLAEVLKNAGGHWQYIGHNIGRHLYLYPEEALYLMEISCLQLRYNGVTVSIQQAYSLLLKDNDALIQYKVYASLSRLGYKVLRHTYVKAEDLESDEAVDKEEYPSSCDEKTDINEQNNQMSVDDSADNMKTLQKSYYNADTGIKEDAPNNGNTCEVTDLIVGQKDDQEANENTDKIEVRVCDNISDCEMRDISNVGKDNHIVKTADKVNTSFSNDANEKQKDKELGTDETDAKVSVNIEDCEMDSMSNSGKKDITKCADKEDETCSDQSCKESGVTDAQGDIKMENNCERATDMIPHCGNISKEEKSNTENAKMAATAEQSLSSNSTCTRVNIAEKLVEVAKKDVISEETVAKEIDKTTDSEISPKVIEITKNEDTGNDEHNDTLKDSLENTNTDHKTECNKNNEVIVQNTKFSNEQCSLVNNKENDTLNDCEIVCMETDDTDEPKESSSVHLGDSERTEIEQDTVDLTRGPSNNGSVAIIQNKIELLHSRVLKPSDPEMVHYCVTENLPDLYQKQVVTIKAPEERLIPRNVFLNNTAYVLNLDNLKLKSVTPAPSSTTRTYSVSDVANAQNVRRIRSGYSNESAQTQYATQFFPNLRFPQQTPQFRPYNYWNQFCYDWNYQRPFFPGMPFRFQFFPRMQPMFRSLPARPMIPAFENSDSRRTRKRKRENPRTYHLESIRKLAAKLKALVASGNRQEQNIEALQRLINTYNVRYKARVELTASIEIVENEIILETINLDDDEQSNSKRGKSEDMKSYDENFKVLKQFSLRIKDLEAKKTLTTRHKRAFSNVIRTFNKSYNADVYVDSNHDVIDRRRIVIASSDSDVEEVQSSLEDTPKPQKNRKLRNPFSILKQLSEKQSPTKPSVSSEGSPVNLKKKFQYSEHYKRIFKYWLPSEDDFGRAEVPLRSQTKCQIDRSEHFLCQFIKSQPFKYENWLEAKIAYWESCKEAALKFETQSQNQSNIKMDSLVNPEDCTNLLNVLKKLSIIKTKKDVLEEGCLSIDFDVYQRDVPNFRKSNKPKPHFRVICIANTSSLPTGLEFSTLHSKYTDDVGILFAIVGVSSISYLQMNPIDLPVYMPTNILS